MLGFLCCEGDMSGEKRGIYIEKISLPAIIAVLFTRRIRVIIILDEMKGKQLLWRYLLRTIGLQVEEASFFVGHLRTDSGECVFSAGRRLAGELAVRASMLFINRGGKLDSLNNKYGRNTIRLCIAKRLHLYIERWTVRIMVAQALSRPGRPEVWLNRPRLFNESLLAQAFPGINLHFYDNIDFWPGRLLVYWLVDVARDLKLRYGFGRTKRSPVQPTSGKPSVLMMQEDTIRADLTLRGQPHWLNVNEPACNFRNYLIELHQSDRTINEDVGRLEKAGLSIISTTAFGCALKAFRKEVALVSLKHDRRGAIKTAFFAGGRGCERYMLLHIQTLLRQAEVMGALALWLNAKVFLVRETYYSFADAMQLVAPDLGVTTVAYQYSNLRSVSPMMMSTADKMLIFADMYKALYETDGIRPQKFLPAGYLFDGVASFLREKAERHREALDAAGTKFVVCYFDESIQHDRWGLVSSDDHLRELQALARAVVNDHTFGAVVKTQFVRNSASRLYPQDHLIQSAKRTGRFLELMEGTARNDIYPTEAALVADLCIGHKFGASAALEAAVAGVRTVLLDPYGIKTLWDGVYAKAAIEYDSIDVLMEAIARYRAGDPNEATLGDWTPILHHFDPYRDGRAAARLRAVLEDAIQKAGEG